MTGDATNAPKDLIGFLDYYLVQKAPFQIPDAGREFIVRFGPWIAIVFLVLSLPALLLALGIGSIAIPAMMVTPSGFGLAAIGTIVSLVLTVLALPGLFARKISGWKLIFYSQLVSIASSLVMGGIVGGLIGGLIGLYILFQIRTLYTA